MESCSRSPPADRRALIGQSPAWPVRLDAFLIGKGSRLGIAVVFSCAGAFLFLLCVASGERLLGVLRSSLGCKAPLVSSLPGGLVASGSIGIFEKIWKPRFCSERLAIMSGSKDQAAVQTADASAASVSLPNAASTAVVQTQSAGEAEHAAPADMVDEEKKGLFAYFKTKEFYITLALG